MTLIEQLKPREIEILRLMADGLTNREISEQLYIGVETVRWYAKQIYGKLHVSGREEASQRALELGLITPKSENLTITSKNNLPTQITPFVGRDAELDELRILLSKPETRLLSVLAPGGMGKTRLCLELASKLIESRSYIDGVYFVPLQAITAHEHVVTQIVTSIDFHLLHDNRTPKEQLLTYLTDKQMLLLIDNWEHLLDASPIVTEILQIAPRIKILATSREKLQLHSEIVYTLQGMQFPTWETPDDALEYDAVKLLTQSAQRVKPDWEVTDNNLDFVARICRLTQGMPLGLVLAAGWLDVYSLERIAEEIQKNVDFLETELRDTPERQRSIRAVFEWTWERLKPNERDVFMKLSVFRNGCTPDAAETIAGANGRILQSLVNRALLFRDNTGRYDIHELLRQYAETQLQQSESVHRAIRDAHCVYYSQLNEDIFVKSFLTTTALISEAEAELENLHTAWQWAVIDFKNDEILESMSFFTLTHYLLGRYSEGINALENAIKRIEVDASDNHQHLLAGLLANQAFLSSYHPISEHSLPEAQRLFQTIDLTQASLPALYIQFMFMMALRRTAPQESINGFKLFVEMIQVRQFEQSITIKLYFAMATWEIAWVYVNLLGDTKKARPYAKDADHVFQDIQSPWGKAIALDLLATIEYEEGNYSHAKSLIEASIKFFRETQEKYNFAIALKLAADISLQEADYEQARRYCAESLRLLKDLGMKEQHDNISADYRQLDGCDESTDPIY